MVIFMFMLYSIPIIIAVVRFLEYKKSSYYKVTGNSYISVLFNKGRYGEYLTYKNLKRMETNGSRFLFNVYIPKSDFETTEIDVLMICPHGIFVFESKNYSGWIFGSETQKNWYQTLPAGRGRSHKEQFYNPIMQNKNHIKHLKSLIGDAIPFYSIITFSDRCTFKSVQVQSRDVSVVHRRNVFREVSAICNHITSPVLQYEKIDDIYNKLYPFTQADADIKMQHINNIQNHFHLSEAQQKKIQHTGCTPIPETTSLPHTSEIDVTSNKCPFCGGSLVKRAATRGANAGGFFYGCSNYPKCRYTRDLANSK